MTDSLLQSLIEVANSYDGIAIPVTLSTGGHLITGFVVSADRWHKEHRKTLRDLTVEDKDFDDWGRRQARQEAILKFRSLSGEMDIADATGTEAENVGYLHLHNVTVHLGGEQSQSLPWWRVPLDSVVGFAAGISSPAESSGPSGDQISPG